jgi:hypothetical protein
VTKSEPSCMVQDSCREIPHSSGVVISLFWIGLVKLLLFIWLQIVIFACWLYLTPGELGLFFFLSNSDYPTRSWLPNEIWEAKLNLDFKFINVYSFRVYSIQHLTGPLFLFAKSYNFLQGRKMHPCWHH